jgi:hypothetical protein
VVVVEVEVKSEAVINRGTSGRAVVVIYETLLVQ